MSRGKNRKTGLPEKRTNETQYNRQGLTVKGKETGKGEACGTEKEYQLEEAAFYHYTVGADRRVFADEVDRQRLLHILGKQAKKYGYEVVAFTVLDDVLEAVLAYPGGRAKNKRTLAESLVKEYMEYYREKRKCAEEVKENVGWSRIQAKQVPEACERIHSLPAQMGYVTEASDYWFSSLNQFREKYQWHFLDVSWIAAVKREAGSGKEKGRITGR